MSMAWAGLAMQARAGRRPPHQQHQHRPAVLEAIADLDMLVGNDECRAEPHRLRTSCINRGLGLGEAAQCRAGAARGPVAKMHCTALRVRGPAGLALIGTIGYISEPCGLRNVTFRPVRPRAGRFLFGGVGLPLLAGEPRGAAASCGLAGQHPSFRHGGLDL
jgi:hypothetical protein